MILSCELVRCAHKRTAETLGRAATHSRKLIVDAGKLIDQKLEKGGLSASRICFVVVGSVGRAESLEASDLDFIPIAVDADALSKYMPFDEVLRSGLRDALKVKVSKGEDLTKGVALAELTEADCIGGANDSSGALTKRILILTESQQLSGGLPLADVRGAIINAYASEDRTRGRHVLSLCNDIARYYKTLCIEYKAKIDDEDKDWCTRNIKLRHSRKLWYFANILAIARLAQLHPLGSHAYTLALLESFGKPPVERLVFALEDTQPIELGRILENYALFLEFMSDPANRRALAAVSHENRYDTSLGNPFLPMKLNSDVMHKSMLMALEGLSPSMRDLVISWFLL